MQTASSQRNGYGREILGATLIVAVALAWRLWQGGAAADATPPAPPPATPASAAAKPEAPATGAEPLALVNGAEITAAQLAAECLARHGRSVLETLVNRAIIAQACRQAGITVTQADVDAEIEVMAKRFKVPREKWLELIEKERGISAYFEREVELGSFDLVVECTGHAGGFSLARSALRSGGTLVMKSTYAGALEVDASALVVDEITLVGSRCGPFAPALNLLASGEVEVRPLIQDRFALDRGLEAFARAAERGVMKVLLDVSEE